MHGLGWRGIKKEERRESPQFLRGTKVQWVTHVLDKKFILILRAMGHYIPDFIAGAGLPIHIIGEVSWEPKEDERGPLSILIPGWLDCLVNMII